jgi:hypothetical protein
MPWQQARLQTTLVSYKRFFKHGEIGNQFRFESEVLRQCCLGFETSFYASTSRGDDIGLALKSHE